jgi:membrane-bound ClpP family serine protease
MNPNTAFCLTILGLLGVYGELIRPGLVWLGVAGLGAALAGGYFLWLASPMPLGLGLLVGALTLFLVDASVETFGIAGMFATAALALGFTRLIVRPNTIQPALAIAVAILFGATTAALNRGARRARRNKRADLFGRE